MKNICAWAKFYALRPSYNIEDFVLCLKVINMVNINIWGKFYASRKLFRIKDFLSEQMAHRYRNYLLSVRHIFHTFIYST